MNRLALLAVVAFLLYACKKKTTDGEGPAIEWNSPVTMTSVFSVDTFLVAAHISDPDGVKRISLRLTDPDGNTLASMPDVFPDQPDYNLETYFLLNRPDLEGGPHFLNLEAFDPENRTSAYREISLNPIPWELQSTIVSHGNPNASTVSKMSANTLDWNQILADGEDVKFLRALHLDGLVLAASAFGGAITAFQYPDFNIAWEHEIPNNTSWRAIESVGVNPKSGETAVGDTDQYIQILNRSGDVVLGFNTGLVQYKPVACALTGSRVYIVERRLDGSDQQFSVFFRVSGALQTRLLFPGEVVKIFSNPAQNYLEDHVAVMVNDDGIPRLKLFNALGLGFEEPITLPQGTLHAACRIDDDRFLFQIDNSIYHYNSGGPLQIYYTTDIEFEDLIYDPVNHQIVGLAEDVLHYFAIQGGLQPIGVIAIPGQGHAMVQLRNR